MCSSSPLFDWGFFDDILNPNQDSLNRKGEIQTAIDRNSIIVRNSQQDCPKKTVSMRIDFPGRFAFPDPPNYRQSAHRHSYDSGKLSGRTRNVRIVPQVNAALLDGTLYLK
jgi:hypothetical protein